MLYLSFGDKNKNRHSKVPKKEPPYQKSGHLKFNFYARVRRLYRKDFNFYWKFGLLLFFEVSFSGEYFYHLPDEKREFILVSRGSTIIRIQRNSMVEMGVMKSILSETKHFPSDNDISATFMIQNEWRYFKKVCFNCNSRNTSYLGCNWCWSGQDSKENGANGFLGTKSSSNCRQRRSQAQ